MTSTTGPGSDPARKPRRRTFSPEYKLRVLAEYEDAASGPERGALLRRERLYHSHIQEWRAARDAGATEKLTDRRTSPVRPKKSAAEMECEKLRRENERLKRELAKNKAAVEVLGKVPMTPLRVATVAG
jgi:transposase-like protein